MEFSVALQQTVSFIVLAVVGIGVPVLVYNLILWVRDHAKEIRARLTIEQNALIDQFVIIAVQAVEQAHLKEQLYATGEEMLAAAVEIVQSFLDSHGLSSIKVADLEARIRAAILEGWNKANEPLAEIEVK